MNDWEEEESRNLKKLGVKIRELHIFLRIKIIILHIT